MLLACFLALGAGGIVGRSLGRQADAAPAVPSTASGVAGSIATVTDGKRYQVPVSMSQPSKGPATALITVVFWSDLGKGDRQAEPIIAALEKEYGKDIRFVFRHLLPGAEQEAALTLHEFAHLTNEQVGKFWELRELVLRQGEPAVPTLKDLERYGAQLGVNWATAKEALERHQFRRSVGGDVLFAEMFGVTKAPTFYVNGRLLIGEPTIERMEILIADELLHARKVRATGIKPEHLYTALTKDALWKPKLEAQPASN